MAVLGTKCKNCKRYLNSPKPSTGNQKCVQQTNATNQQRNTVNKQRERYERIARGTIIFIKCSHPDEISFRSHVHLEIISYSDNISHLDIISQLDNKSDPDNKFFRSHVHPVERSPVARLLAADLRATPTSNFLHKKLSQLQEEVILMSVFLFPIFISDTFKIGCQKILTICVVKPLYSLIFNHNLPNRL